MLKYCDLWHKEFKIEQQTGLLLATLRQFKYLGLEQVVVQRGCPINLLLGSQQKASAMERGDGVRNWSEIDDEYALKAADKSRRGF